MASFSKRTYTSWSIQCSSAPALNQTFYDAHSAHARLRELAEQGYRDAKIKRLSSLGWQARVRRKGFADLNKTFPRRDMAEQWAAEKEGEIVKRQFVDYREAERHTLGDLLLKYDTTRLAGRPKHDPDRTRANKLRTAPIAGIQMSLLQPSDFAAYRDARCKQVKGSTVKKELELFCRVIAIARREWSIHLPINPASGEHVSRPAAEEGDERSRRLRNRHAIAVDGPALTWPQEATRTQARRRVREDIDYEYAPEIEQIISAPQSEQQALFRACRYPHWFTQRKCEVTEATLKARAKRAAATLPIKARLRPGRRIWAIASFAIETAMRRGEMLKLRWAHVHLAMGYVDLPGSITKNGQPRVVPLTRRAQRILATQPRTSEFVFSTNANTVKLAFRRALERARCTDLRLHDLRHEATSRFFERTNLRAIEIGRMTGHSDPRMLQRYYNMRPDEFVDRFKRSFKRSSG